MNTGVVGALVAGVRRAFSTARDNAAVGRGSTTREYRGGKGMENERGERGESSSEYSRICWHPIVFIVDDFVDTYTVVWG